MFESMDPSVWLVWLMSHAVTAFGTWIFFAARRESRLIGEALREVDVLEPVAVPEGDDEPRRAPMFALGSAAVPAPMEVAGSEFAPRGSGLPELAFASEPLFTAAPTRLDLTPVSAPDAAPTAIVEATDDGQALAALTLAVVRDEPAAVVEPAPPTEPAGEPDQRDDEPPAGGSAPTVPMVTILSPRPQRDWSRVPACGPGHWVRGRMSGEAARTMVARFVAPIPVRRTYEPTQTWVASLRLDLDRLSRDILAGFERRPWLRRDSASRGQHRAGAARTRTQRQVAA